jgi:L-glutamine-phosphate cytidylyltransferase
MKAIILAAGQGTRLRPLTNDKPKCMVEFRGKPIIDYIVESLEEANITNIHIVNGYKKEVLESYMATQDVKFLTNPNFDSTNMVSTLFCAETEMDDDIIVSYADIIYNPKVIKNLLDSDSDLSVVVDRNWKRLWEIRMDNPLDDVETMKVNDDGNIIELGKKPKNIDEIDGQYIGLIKFSKKIIPKIRAYYHSLDKNITYDAKNFDNMYMTTFLQLLINNVVPAKAIHINGGWLEIDSIEDLNNYQKHTINLDGTVKLT